MFTIYKYKICTLLLLYRLGGTSQINTFRGFSHASVVMNPTAKVLFYWGSHTEGKMRERRRLSYPLCYRQKQFSSGRGKGPDFASRRRQFLKSQPENF
jgi:hypothetical protein